MNGRIFDAKLARFLQADPFIQAATNTQSYNRYSYTFNNPLNATDPSGYLSGSFKKSLKKYAGAIASVAIVAFCYACAPEVLGAWLATAAAINAKFNGASGSQIFASALMAYVGGAVGASGGEGAIYMSGVVGGVSALMSGGNFGNSFVTSLASSYLGGKVRSSTSSTVRIAGASIIGGTASKVTGGKFVSGAATAAFNAAIVDKDIEAYQLAVEKDKLIREFAGMIACEGDCGEAIASALKGSAQKDNVQKGPSPDLIKAYEDLHAKFVRFAVENKGENIPISDAEFQLIVDFEVARISAIDRSLDKYLLHMSGSSADIEIFRDHSLRNRVFAFQGGTLERGGNINYIGVGMMAAHYNTRVSGATVVWNVGQAVGLIRGGAGFRQEMIDLPHALVWGAHGTDLFLRNGK